MQSSVVGVVLEKLLESAVSSLIVSAAALAIILCVAAMRKAGALLEDSLRHRWVHATADWVASGVDHFRTTQQNRYGDWLVVRAGIPIGVAFCCAASGLMLLAFSVVLGGNVLWVSFTAPSAVPMPLWVLAGLSPLGAMLGVDCLVDAWRAVREAARELYSHLTRPRDPDARP
jgi:hypothetical protein